MATTRHGITFDRVLDAVADLGMDPNGGDPINQALESAVSQDGTLVKFPSGRYNLSGDVEVFDSSRIGMATDESAVIFAGADNNVINFEGGDDHLVDGFTFDDTDGAGYIAFVDDVQTHGEFRNLDWVGFRPDDNGPGNSNSQSFNRIHVQQESGVYNVVNVNRWREPSRIPAYPDGSSYIYAGTDMRGTLNIEDCRFSNSTSHALYCTQSPGTVNVRNCTFKNNNGWQIRAASPDGVVENCRVIIDSDDAPSGNVYPDGERYPSMTSAIWCVRQHEPWDKAGTYRDIEIEVRSTPDHLRAFRAVRHDGAAGPVTFKNVNVRVSEAANPVVPFSLVGWSQLGQKPSTFPPNGTSLVNCSVSGAATDDGGRGLVHVEGRNVTIDGSCLHTTAGRPGIFVRDARDRLSYTDGGVATVASTTSVTTGGKQVETGTGGTISGTDNLTSGSDCTGDSGGGGSSPPEETGTPVEITNDGSGRTTYSIHVDGEITNTDGLGTGDEVRDAPVGQVVSGFVNGGVDAFSYTGCIRSAEFEGVSPTITRSGTGVSPSGLVECPPAQESGSSDALLAAATAVGTYLAVKWLLEGDN